MPLESALSRRFGAALIVWLLCVSTISGSTLARAPSPMGIALQQASTGESTERGGNGAAYQAFYYQLESGNRTFQSNSSPISEVGTVIGSVNASSMRPTEYSFLHHAVFDPWDKDLYFTAGMSLGAGCPPSYGLPVVVPSGVAAVSQFAVVGNYSTTMQINNAWNTTFVGIGQAQGIDYDSANHFLYVAVTPTESTPLPFHGGAVVVLNGTRLVTNITGPEMNAPVEVVYDPADGLIYVANACSGTVVMISGTRVVGTISTGTIEPSGATFDPENGDVYISGVAGTPVTVINGTAIVGTIGEGSADFNGTSGIAYDPVHHRLVVSGVGGPNGTNQTPAPGWIAIIDGNQTNGNNTESRLSALPWSPDEAAFNPANGLMYVGDAQSNSLVAFDGISPVGEITEAAQNPLPGAYDPTTGDFYSPSWGLGMPISVISARLEESVPTVGTPSAYPPSTMYTGQRVIINTTLLAVGSGNDTATIASSPEFGIICDNPPDISVGSFVGSVRVNCTPTSPLNFSVWLNVTDSTGAKVWSEAQLTVFSPIGLGPIQVSPTPATVGETLWLNASVHGGSSMLEYRWVGLPPGCSGTTATIECAPNASGSFTVTVAVTDSLAGRSALSDPVVIQVFSSGISRTAPPNEAVGPSIAYILALDAALAATLVAFVVLRRMHWRRRKEEARRP